MAKLKRWIPSLLRLATPLLLSGGVVNAVRMSDYGNFDLTNYLITGAWLVGAGGSAATAKVLDWLNPPVVGTTVGSAKQVQALRRQAAALMAEADAMQNAIQAEAREASQAK